MFTRAPFRSLNADIQSFPAFVQDLPFEYAIASLLRFYRIMLDNPHSVIFSRL